MPTKISEGKEPATIQLKHPDKKQQKTQQTAALY